MTARKRKAPDRRKAPVEQPGLVWRVVSAAGRLALSNPRGVGGGLCLTVAISFVVANALWYQPGSHPAPFLRTRDPDDPNAIAGYRPARRAEPLEVTTFRIERAGQERVAAERAPAPPPRSTDVAAPEQKPAVDTVSQPAPPHTASVAETGQLAEAPPQTADLVMPPVTHVIPIQRPSGDLNAVDPVAAAIRAAERAPQPRPPVDIPTAARMANAQRANEAAIRPTNISVSSEMELVMQIQRGLVNIAYTDVTIDGVAGAQTRAAIRHFQKHYRLPQTGEPSEAVLKKLKSIGAL